MKIETMGSTVWIRLNSHVFGLSPSECWSYRRTNRGNADNKTFGGIATPRTMG